MSFQYIFPISELGARDGLSILSILDLYKFDFAYIQGLNIKQLVFLTLFKGNRNNKRN